MAGLYMPKVAEREFVGCNAIFGGVYQLRGMITRA